jgi:hypothetical protein
MTDNSCGQRGRHARFWRLSSAFGPFAGRGASGRANPNQEGRCRS